MCPAEMANRPSLTIDDMVFRHLPKDQGFYFELRVWDPETEKSTTACSLTSEPEKPLTLEIYDWELTRSNTFVFLQLPLLEAVIQLPEIHEYVYQLATGTVEGSEELSRLEVNIEKGEVIELAAVAIENIIDVRYINQTTLQIKLPKKLAVCEECGVVYAPRQKGQKYHSRKCANRASVRAFRERQRTQDE